MRKLLQLLSIFIINSPVLTTTVACCECSNSTLSSILKIKDLAKIYVGLSALPTIDTIKNAIKENNKDIDTNALIVSDITNTKAKVTGDDIKYTGELEVNYISENFEDMGVTINGTILSSVITSDGMMYVGTKVSDTQGKLYTVNTNTNQVTDITNSGGTNIDGQVTSLEKGTNGDIYVGTMIVNGSSATGHLYKINNNTKQTIELQTGNISGGVSCLKVSKNDIVYIGTTLDIVSASGILYYFIPSTNTLVNITNVSGGGSVPIEGAKICLTIGENDSLYVGTHNNSLTGKLYKVDATYHATDISNVTGGTTISHEVTNLTTGNNNDIYAAGIGTLYRINSTTNIATDITNVSGGATIAGTPISLTTGNNNDVYISIESLGDDGLFYKIDNTTNIATNITDPSKGDTIKGNIKTITIDTNGHMYIWANDSSGTAKLYKTYENI